jgi:glycogen debranching enzyme
VNEHRAQILYGSLVVSEVVMKKILLGFACACSSLAYSQTSLSGTKTERALPSISREAVANKPFSLVGPRGALLGQQDGGFEAWIFPWKILDNVRLSVNIQDSPVPISVNAHAAEIDVQPDKTTITYSHANFTIRQIMLAPKTGPANTGALVFYQIEAIRPMTITFTFDPIMQRMWPAQSGERPSPEWVKNAGGSGFYILHQNLSDQAAALAMPGAEPGILPPYQEGATASPLQFVLHFDPKQDSGKMFPLLMTFADSKTEATKEAFGQSLAALNAQSRTIFDFNREYYHHLLAQHTAIETPDANLNAAFAWAEASIDQLRVKTTPDLKEEALTAGFVSSGGGARPGFGWFFGRDSLWSLYAINSYGDFALTKQEIQFLLHRQRDDGKIMHEWSQTANLVDWKSMPYEWASSDATLLFPMAVNDYLKISGNRQFVTSIWPNLESAWKFETTHDSDGDGIYDNAQGTGWVESWVPRMPHQEIYLAALDQQASTAFANLARATGHDQLAAAAEQRAARIGETIEKEYYLAPATSYAFSWEGNGKTDDTATIFPAVAWWDNSYRLQHADPLLERWASSEFSTDWGTRILSDQASIYDPISYHRGSVWPLFTGWVSVAEYRAGHPLSAYAHLMQNANLTWSQDPGNTTELLSGQFYQVFGRSTAHQLWSSAMVISPVLRGLFGLEWDALSNTLTVTPHLPADWTETTIRRVPFGDRSVDLTFRRRGRELVVEASGGAKLRLTSHAKMARMDNGRLHIPLPAVEAAIAEALPEFGTATHQMKVLAEEYGTHSLTLRLAAPNGSMQKLVLRENIPVHGLATRDAQLGTPVGGMRALEVKFPEGTGYVEKTVTLTW